MPKASDWKIIATEGATIDGRKLLRQWFTEMAESYSPKEYTAMIWPEHYRFGGFGNNWGTVEEVKAEELDGKMRLFAKITPNQFLLAANKLGQKLFTSIEIEPDYKGEGRCYLKGLAVTDSPASTGTSRLEFSVQNGDMKTLESDRLEHLDFSECQPNSLVQAISTLFTHFSSGKQEPEMPTEPEDTKVTEEELKAALKEQFSNFSTSFKQELAEEFNLKKPEQPEVPERPEMTGVTVEQFSQLNEKLDGIITQQSELDKQFKALSEEVPGQRPGEEGSSESTEEAL
ncbi:capsid protein [Vibrio coralliilyticus]|nr:capsid protein [Vibrio coralliilyticus]